MLSWGSETNMFALCMTRLLFHHHCFCSMEEEEEGKKVEKRERGLRKVFPTEEILLKSIFKTWVFFGEKRRVHHLIEKVTNTYENHFSRSYENCYDVWESSAKICKTYIHFGRLKPNMYGTLSYNTTVQTNWAKEASLVQIYLKQYTQKTKDLATNYCSSFFERGNVQLSTRYHPWMQILQHNK